MKKEEVLEIRIELVINSRTTLFIALGRDGALARQGNGTLMEYSKDRYLSENNGEYFDEIINNIDEDMFNHFGLYDMPEKEGEPCRLSVVFKDEKEVNGFEFHYGFKSNHGPHVDVLNLVEQAVKLTDPWFHGVSKKNRKKWWKF